ncbi:MAG: PhzF family phenazine biosynthesis protein [Hyphomicrobiaceae bacterium]|nr:PhzF family phenazine biosynthesis protein [Hyphomicrobiaceae bacterium]
MQLAFHTLDVFTDKPLSGNPLAVVLDADQLATDAMQAVAREFNLSETVFVQQPTSPAHTARVRIFTPAAEVPFAGHPTVGTAILMATLRAADPGGDLDAIVSLEQKIGIVRVGVRLRRGQAGFAELDAPRLPEEAGRLPPTERLAAAVGLLPSEIGFANHRPTGFGAGNSFAFVPVASLQAMARAAVNEQHWAAAMAGRGEAGVFLYCRETVHTASSFHARMFAPDMGVPEDPATGSAAAAFAGVVSRFDGLPDGQHRRVIEQGFEMGRPSIITLVLDVERGQLHTVRVGGNAVRVSEGRITI